jgi:FkbM family methyltransferase
MARVLKGYEVSKRQPWRFRWSHQHPLHRLLVRTLNRVLSRIPLRPQYMLSQILRRNKMPYKLVGSGSTFVQVGAPSDTLRSGRSRGLHLALRTRHGGGLAIIVEPDPTCAEAFRVAAERLGLDHVSVVNCGAWHEAGSLNLLVDPSHPATNFVEGCVDYSSDRLADFRPVTVPVDTLDHILFAHGVRDIDLISITTNGAEPDILKGMSGVVAGGLKYLSLACTGPGYDQIVKDLGFEFLAFDDRGYTYIRRS